MTNDLSLLDDVRNAEGAIGTARPHDLICTALGTASLNVKSSDVYLPRVLYVPFLKENLISVLALIRSGINVAPPTPASLRLFPRMYLSLALD